jgi:hypothetical protein
MAKPYSDEERNRYPEEERGWREGHGESDLERAGRAMTGYAERWRAREEPERREEPQWNVPGPFTGRGPKNYKRRDESIMYDICDRLTQHGQIDATDVEVEVRQGEAILRGYVRTRYEKRIAEDVADSVSGVQDVQNQLRVAGYEERSSRDQGMVGTWRGREAGREGRKVGRANLSVFGIYRDRPAVEKAVDALKAAGFRNTDISVLFPQTEGTKDFAFEKGTKAPEGATTGAGSGMVAGGVLGWLVGIGSLAIPGVGPLIAAGPIVAALAGMGIGGAVGGITGALIGMGMPEYEAKRYEGRVKSGHILLSVHCDDRDWAKRAEEILDNTGAYDISRSGEESADYAESDKPMPRA